MNRPARITALVGYVLLSLALPAMPFLVLLALRTPELTMVTAVVQADSARFSSPQAALGGGAVHYFPDTRSEYPNAQSSAAALFPDSSLVILSRYVSPSAARATLRDLIGRIDHSSISQSPSRVGYTERISGRSGTAFVVDRYLVEILAPTSEIRDRRMIQIPAVQPHPDPNWAAVGLDRYTPVLILVGALWLVAQAAIWPRLGSWALTEPASREAKSNPSDAEELKARLRELTRGDSPLEVSVSRDEVLIEWQYADSRWTGLMARGRVTGLHRIRLRIDPPKRRVRARDEHANVEWNQSGLALASGLSWRSTKGIALAGYRRGVQYGLKVEDGRAILDPDYFYRFSLSELKTPVVRAVTQAGWDYVPVAGFSRIISG